MRRRILRRKPTAAGTIVTIPPVILALLLQKRVITGLTASAVKQEHQTMAFPNRRHDCKQDNLDILLGVVLASWAPDRARQRTTAR